VNHISNPALKILKQDWPGTPIDNNGRFVNHEFPFIPNFKDLLKWKFSAKPQNEEKKADTFRLKTQNDVSFLQHNRDCIIWLGHATFFIRLNGISLLIDPVYYKVPFVNRYAEHVFSLSVFTKLDYLLISHDHQDHCQEKSVKELVKLNPDVSILTGLNMEGLLKSWVPKQKIQTAGWYQQFDLPEGLDIYFMASRHWAKRSANDDNKRLWGGFVFQTNTKSIYCSGDTGYGGHFREANALFPHLDVAIIGVGAFKPEWFMSPNHMSPKDGVRAFHELGAKVMIPMHYGTFDLSDEPVGEPVRILLEMEKKGEINGNLKLLDLGENLMDF